MKTYHIKDLLKKDLLIVELPRVCDYELTKEGLFVKEHGSHLSDYIEGSYTLLGKPDEIREEDAKELVENKGKYYKNYSPIQGSVQGNITFTATESLLSAIESKIYWENPYKDWLSHGEAHDDDLDHLWHEAESRTFDRNRSIILVKN
ncbi:hypothetical protein H0S70_07090 [Chryseobacterium manosquense]|uniref:Uncharacterized protein n=1 Tax=Chryseobacterium manosquense TaxID=2754694 RepID=A0A7H1DT63_9FLAO|nr:hypothetical protein [Chryseobacterium manosquense]QNS40171.1 hypothetical protein H0S70_07090 [Chryseobacterium manosquense]